jgi:hypothetical protein
MKRIGYINGKRVTGIATNIKRLKGIKRGATGAVSLTAAPTTKKTYTGVGGTKATKSLTVGLTGADGGRNFIKGKFSGINTNATKKVTLTGSVVTVGGTFKLGTAKGTHTATGNLSNTAPKRIGMPGTLVCKAKVTAGKLATIKVSAIKVNALTTVML